MSDGQSEGVADLIESVNDNDNRTQRESGHKRLTHFLECPGLIFLCSSILGGWAFNYKLTLIKILIYIHYPKPQSTLKYRIRLIYLVLDIPLVVLWYSVSGIQKYQQIYHCSPHTDRWPWPLGSQPWTSGSNCWSVYFFHFLCRHGQPWLTCSGLPRVPYKSTDNLNLNFNTQWFQLLSMYLRKANSLYMYNRFFKNCRKMQKQYYTCIIVSLECIYW